MTLTKKLKTMETPSKMIQTTGEVLREAVWQALDQGRLTCGVHQCARLLEINPFNTMLCVLPESRHGVSAVSEEIKHILIEAFCTEYDIRTIKVDDADKLSKMVLGREAAVMDNAGASNKGRQLASSFTHEDNIVDCLLIQYPDDTPSKEDEMLAEHHKTCLFCDVKQECIISLPD